MNIVDYVIIGIIGISVLFGLYRGFIASVLNMGCGLMSFLASFWVSPKLAAAVQSNQSFLNMLLHYTDASSRIGDLEARRFDSPRVVLFHGGPVDRALRVREQLFNSGRQLTHIRRQCRHE